MNIKPLKVMLKNIQSEKADLDEYVIVSRENVVDANDCEHDDIGDNEDKDSLTERYEHEEASGSDCFNESLPIDDAIKEKENKVIWNELLLKFKGRLKKDDDICLKKSPAN